MQTTKGLIALLVVAAVVFAVAARSDIGSQDRYAAAMSRPAPAEEPGKAVLNVTSSRKPGEAIPNAAGKVANMKTNVANRARLKTPRA